MVPGTVMPAWTCILLVVMLVAAQIAIVWRISRSRRRALEDFRAQKEFADNLIQSSREMIISVNLERQITLFNKAAERAFGYSREEVLGRNIRMLYDSDKDAARVQREIKERGAFTGEVLNRRKDGSVFPSFLVASPLRDAMGHAIGTMGISLDISDQKHAEQERERLVRAKDEFIAIASHDLKSPLGSIAGYAQLLEKLAPVGSVMNEENFGFIQRIRALSGVMQKIVEDFLDFNALQDGRLKLSLTPSDLNAIAAEVVENFAARACHKRIALSFQACEGLPPANADPARIEQVIENLVGNAIKFCAEGCRVRVRTRPDSDGVVLEVEDNGPGLRDEDMLKVFSRYARLSNKPTGGEKSSGLGLAICKELVDLHGGQIGVRNNPDGGATFWFCVPAVDPGQRRLA